MDIPDWNPFENLTRNTHLQNYGRFKGFKHQKLSKLFDMSKIDMKLIKNAGEHQQTPFLKAGTLTLSSGMCHLKCIFKYISIKDYDIYRILRIF